MSQGTAFPLFGSVWRKKKKMCFFRRYVREIIYLVNMCLDEKKSESTRGTESTRLNINIEEVRGKNKLNMDHFRERN